MRLLNKENNSIIEIKDKTRIEKLLGYPDKFEKVEEEKQKIKEDIIETEKVEEETPKFNKRNK